ncbi:MAG: hypothetical protein IKQ32_00665 [Prevotella sp.]|nr:hypothetical protein [Prevotella sp.]
MIDVLDLQKLRDLPIEGVAERLGMEVVRHKALCPFHDDHHASLSFSVRRNTFRCFVCGEHGGVIDLVMRRLRKDFREATEWLNGGAALDMPKYQHADMSKKEEPSPFDASRYARYFEHPWLSDEARRFLFEERRIDERVVRWCRLTSWRDRHGVPWLQIPYYDQEWKLVGVQNRNLTPSPSPKGEGGTPPEGGSWRGAVPRFRFPQGSQCGIYNLPVLNRLKPGDELWITEGCSDCWAMLSSGRKAIAIPSATLLKHKQLLELTIRSATIRPTGYETSLRDYDNEDSQGGLTFPLTFHMYPDRDEPGERLFLQLKEVLPTLQHHQLPQGCKDFGEYYKSLPKPLP